jgi:acetoin utilization deacetylase AcuC-like enzyme
MPYSQSDIGRPKDNIFALYSCENYPLILPEDHPFPFRKYPILEELLQGCKRPFSISRVGVASREKVATVHGQAYLNRLFGNELSPEETRKLGFPWGEAYLNRALASVEATYQSTLTVLEGRGRVAGALAGGTHHAYADHGEGYCTFNDIAIAAKHALMHWVDRVLVVDLDAHQGNGTASIFKYEPRVFTFSMHCEENYPRIKEKSSWDIGLAKGAGDGEYLELLVQNLPKIVESFRPELVFFQAGVDVLAADRFGKLGLSMEGLRARDAFVARTFYEEKTPCVLTIGGGYQRSARAVAMAHAQTYEVWAEVFFQGQFPKPAALPLF